MTTTRLIQRSLQRNTSHAILPEDRLPGAAASGVGVGEGDHAVAALGDGVQAQVRALAGAEQRGTAARHDRVDGEAQLVDEAVLEQRLGELAVTVDHKVPVAPVLELPYG